ncbi:MAG: glycosyl hydrolase family 39 [Pseudomonadota bacterium]|nr:glycosyl hydrolase family 39 [Pseudomonadota bacterium]
MKTAFIFMLACLTPWVAWSDEEVMIDPSAPHHSFPHYWEQMFGSGRAILTLRDSYRRDLRSLKNATDFKFVRFHAILHDEIGVYDEDMHGKAVYNFSYIDQIYDGLLENGVRPFVELSFMPRKLASREAVHSFKYHPIVAPPRDYAKWDALISSFATHLIERFGIDEVAQWYFEVWNEPNLDFWAGTPKQASYWTLYDHTAKALKGVNARLRVGGPSTAQAAWVGAFIRHATDRGVPLDFVSTHVYGNDTSTDVFATHEKIPRNKMVCRAAKKVRDEVNASARPELPIIWSEYNATYFNEPKITDVPFMGPWLADTVRRCDGLTDMMSYWTFSDVFEEQGVVRRPFYGGFGLIAAGGVPKPAFNAFKMLHQLGVERLDADSDHALVTQRADGTLVIALWNYAPPGENGVPTTISLRLPHAAVSARLLRLDADHGDAGGEYARMGSPQYPTAAQLHALTEASALPASEDLAIENERVSVSLPPNGLATVEVTLRRP